MMIILRPAMAMCSQSQPWVKPLVFGFVHANVHMGGGKACLPHHGFPEVEARATLAPTS